MRFEGRDLKPYAEPVIASELREGSVYFTVQFADRDMLIPMVETLVFIGRNSSVDDVGFVRFQTIDSYNEGIRYDSATEDEMISFRNQPEDQLKHFFDYEHALNELMKCAMRREKRRGGG